ncbi:hypothetical protein K474DRAFT_1493614 [Panus rudis PR-1116 ss-1]|nr:hypothetical protein K474DRAFT_1493614 [Panus rudis PR-1116 ss-1]
MPISILQFSPDGKHLVIMEQDGTWEFYDTQGRPSQIPPNIKRAEQLAWVDRGVLCVFTRERILLWGLEHSRVVNIEQWKSGFQAAVRLPQDDVLLLVQKSIAYELRFNGIWRDKHDFGGVSIEQIAPIKGTTFLLCAGTMKRRQSSSHPETECHIIIYNTANKQIY